ncbi:uncharacterized protein [Cicer arietinum]|uniref:Uncharacterized protein LOC101503590 n=1 Tax=Cicer arietinum TaxID=3827 RepID=A0A1S2Z0H5_CICAR|nr:uncharacterized protein LOC101503590 [Cicer arietinum]
MDHGEDNSDEIYEGLEPDFEDMNDCLERDFDEMYDDFDAMNDIMNKGGEDVMVILTDVFSTGMMFDTRDDLLKWARNVGRENGVVVVIFRSENATTRPRTKTKLILGCERSGKYRPWKNPKPTRSTWSRKCECPFRLRGTPSNVGDGWYLHVICGVHNHEFPKKSQEEKVVLGDMTKNMIKPRNILMTINDHNVTSLTTIKQVYNARQAYRSSLRGNRTEMQHLLTLMERDKYVYRYRKVEGSNELRDIFWTHPDAISFSERVDNFTWALQMLKEHITGGEVEVIVTNRDLALMNAVECVFPKAWLIPHKERFVEAWTNRVMHFGNTTTQRVESVHWSLKRILQDSIGDICSVWETINSMIVHRHSNRLYANLRGVVSKNAIDHIAVEFDHVKYVGIDKSECRCTIRRTHGLPCACEIARYSMIPRSISLDVIHVWWTKLTFHDDGSGKPSELSVQHEIEVIVKKFDELDVSGNIALKGKLREIVYPSTTSMCPPVDKVKKKGAPKKGKSKISKRDKSTKRDPSWWEYVDASVRCSGTNACSTVTSNKVQQPRPSVTKLTPRPSVNKVQEPRVLIFNEWLPVEIYKFIDDIIDVGEDGNCGYRAVAALLGMGENFWAFIRQECMVELQEFMSHYEIIYGGQISVQQLIHNVYVEHVATLDNWMTFLEMGYVIASKFNLVFVALSLNQSETFFPLRSPPPTPIPDHHMIVIAFVNNCHFVQVYLKPNSPIPPPSNLWRKYCTEEARQWEFIYNDHIQHWLKIFPCSIDEYVVN